MAFLHDSSTIRAFHCVPAHMFVQLNEAELEQVVIDETNSNSLEPLNPCL